MSLETNTFIFYLEAGLETIQKRTGTRGKKFLQNFISSRDGPEKGTCRNKAEMKEHKSLPYYGTMAEKKDKKTTLHVHLLSTSADVG